MLGGDGELRRPAVERSVTGSPRAQALERELDDRERELLALLGRLADE